MSSNLTLHVALLAEQEQISLLENIATQARIIREKSAQKKALTSSSTAPGSNVAETQHIPKERASESSSAGHRGPNNDAPQQRSAPVQINLTQSDGSDGRSHISLSSDTESESGPLFQMQDKEIQEPVTFNEEEDDMFMTNEYLDEEIAKQVEMMEQPYQSTQESELEASEVTASLPTQSAFVRPIPGSKRVLHVRGGKSRMAKKLKGRKVPINAWLRRRP